MRMDPRDYTVMLQDALAQIADDPSETLFAINGRKGHMQELHIGASQQDLLMRLMASPMNAVTSFYDEQTAKRQTADALYFNTDKIEQWMYTPQRYFKNKDDYYTFAASIEMGIPVGYGINRHLRVRECRAINFVLTRDKTGESPYGFFLKTAYPVITKSATTIMRYETPEELFGKFPALGKTVMQETYFRSIREMTRRQIRYGEGNARDYVSVRYFRDGKDPQTIVAYIYEDRLSFRRLGDAGNERINLQTIMLGYPDIYADVDRICRTRNQVMKKRGYNQNKFHGTPQINKERIESPR